MFNEKQKHQLLQPLQAGAVKRNNKGFEYVSNAYVIRRANDIFGFGGWSSEVVESILVDESKSNKGGFVVTYMSTVKITILLENGNTAVYSDSSTHTGFGSNKGGCYDLALKGSISKAKKRAFRNLGDQFGLILYKDSETFEPIEPQPLNDDNGAYVRFFEMIQRKAKDPKKFEAFLISKFSTSNIKELAGFSSELLKSVKEELLALGGKK